MLEQAYEYIHERLVLQALLAPEAAGDTFHILMPVVTESAEQGRGWVQSFSLDCSGREAERHWFADHLNRKHLEIEVWDAASQMQLGCVQLQSKCCLIFHNPETIVLCTVI